MDFPQPDISETSRPYWEGLRAGRLLAQRCSCGHLWLPARKHCPRCLGDDARWEPLSGAGKVVSWVVYHTAYHPAFEGRLPYNVALVELAEGPRVLTNIVDGNDVLAADLPVELQVEWEGDVALARFRVAGAGAQP